LNEEARKRVSSDNGDRTPSRGSAPATVFRNTAQSANVTIEWLDRYAQKLKEYQAQEASPKTALAADRNKECVKTLTALQTKLNKMFK
jgi:hypothetical protein